jgi:hypothetical protein
MAARGHGRRRFRCICGHLGPSGGPSAWIFPRRSYQQENRRFPAVLMELAGLEPATSWVRSRRSPRTRARVPMPATTLHSSLLTGAPNGAPPQAPLQIGTFVTVSKAVRGHWPLEGSNPSPSAQPSRSSSGSRFGAAACGLSNRNAQSIEVRGGLQASTGFGRHWRTTGDHRDPSGLGDCWLVVPRHELARPHGRALASHVSRVPSDRLLDLCWRQGIGRCSRRRARATRCRERRLRRAAAHERCE